MMKGRTAQRNYRHLDATAALLVLTMAAATLGAGGASRVAPSIPSRIWLDPNNSPLPFRTDEAVLDFLRGAEVLESKYIGAGVTGAQKILLRSGDVTAHACFRTIREQADKAMMSDGSYRFNFRDDAVFEVAAYELNRLLGMNNVPPVVERAINGQKGTLQIWVERAMTEGKRLKNDIQPPEGLRYRREIQDMQVFDNLIYNVDRNKGNVLIDSKWRVWLIDHTRSFRRYAELREPHKIDGISRDLWDRLRNLDPEEVRAKLSPYIKPQELRGLLKRRQVLVDYIDGLINARSEDRVLFSKVSVR